MKVKSLLCDRFDEACNELTQKVESDYKPNVIIGILTGGGYVSRKVKDRLKQPCSYYAEVKIQRNSTQTKNRLRLDKVFKLLPVFILNALRIAESFYFEQKKKYSSKKLDGNIDLESGLKELLKDGGQRVLIVDDSIDTGSTVAVLKQSLERISDTNDIKVAVVNVTQRDPYVFPDFYLYNRVLIRFPWSSDAK